MRLSAASFVVCPVLIAGLALACRQPSPPPITERPPYLPAFGEGFSGERSWRDLEALAAIGPRVAGSEGSRRAREYISDQLAELGLQVETREVSLDLGEGADPLVLTNLWADLPGESQDLVVLAAPYDTRAFESFEFIGANDGASGPAVLLELARNLDANPLHYTTRVVFLDGEAPRPAAEGRELRLLGSTSLAGDFKEQGLIPRIRLLVVFNKVADADLRISRDLYSHRTYREEFWQAAQSLQYTEAFPPDRGFESVPGSHHPFRSVGLRRVVAIVDTSFGGDEPPGVYANSEDDTLDHLSPESLQVVGQVTLDTLDRISRRLAKIDRFSAAPLAEEVGAIDYPTPEMPAPKRPTPEQDTGETPEAQAETPAEAPAATASEAPRPAGAPASEPEAPPVDAADGEQKAAPEAEGL